MKKVISILFVIIILCIFFNQWDQFITDEQTVNAQESAQTNVTIHSDEKSVQVFQTISSLSDKSIYEIIVPEKASNWTCTYNDKDECKRVWRAENIIETKGSQLHITYSLPLNKKTNTLIRDWLFQLKGVTIDHVELKIIESHHRNGKWLAGIPLSGFVKEDLIDYYFFSGKTNNPALLWYNEEINTERNETQYSYYGNHYPEIKELIQKHEEKVKEANFLSIITTNQLKSGLFGGILILPSGELLERELVDALYFHSIESEEIEWLLDLLTSFIIDENPRFDLSMYAFNELKEKLTSRELEQLVANISDLDESFVPEDMDEILYQITGKQTNFFAELLRNKQPVSLELYTMKDYHWNNKKLTVKVIEIDGIEWVPLQKTMSFLEFETERLSETEWAIFNDKDVYRLYSDQSIFIRNEEVFGLLEHPLKKMNGEYYLEKKWLQSIFHINFREEGNKVYFDM
ncbi:hypothetical protein [Cytobacillus kochii]|uniref:Uncharacterized protein n=1 Tax=Cytobacillus kochii TaxID=859143 RepID=A0A248TD22_9BACI|nr:hypothetical protein [Cytobacillus kochii]ASV66064.1 hypothetical protein CKF48_01215 [Cytobacillus kochii]